MTTSAAIAKYRAHRTGKLKFGRCILAERSRSKNSFSKHLLRQREIETVIRSRYVDFVPETHDADVFIEAAAPTRTAM